MTPEASICVIVAARNASDTIQRAIGSALREPAVAELVVVDDASTDDTAAASREAEDGSGRLKVLTLPVNKGPAFARNHAIANSSAPLISILDADDFFLNGRFNVLLRQDDWDFIADNIVFIDEQSADLADPDVAQFAVEPRMLDLTAFVEGNISRRGASRGEIGFLKPVMSRAFLDAHALRYNDELRLGEDYDFYARALALGARYRIVHSCGYGAIVRRDSLSGRHRTLDLQRLYEADQKILTSSALPTAAAAALRRHQRHVRARYDLRRFLDIKAEVGLVKAGLHALANPAALPAIIAGVAGDKLEAFARKNVAEDSPAKPRYLLPGRIVA